MKNSYLVLVIAIALVIGLEDRLAIVGPFVLFISFFVGTLWVGGYRDAK
jgi:hypothetical protein